MKPTDAFDTSVGTHRGKWRVRWRHHATREWKHDSTHPNEAAARGRERELITELVQGRGAARARAALMTVGSFVEEIYWDLPQAQVVNQKNERSHWEHHIKERWEKWRLESITTQDTREWIEELRTRPKYRGDGVLAPNTQKQIYILFSKIIRAAYEMHYLFRVPLPIRPRNSAQALKSPRFLEEVEVARLADAAGAGNAGDWSDSIYTLAHGGFRISEFLALRADDLDHIHRTVRVDQQVKIDALGEPQLVDILKTRRSHRHVPVHRHAFDMLVERANRADNEYGLLFAWTGPATRYRRLSRAKVMEIRDRFADGTGAATLAVEYGVSARTIYNVLARNHRHELHESPVMRPDWYRHNVFEPAVEVAELAPLTPHDLRHTFASALWDERPNSLEEIAIFLGDSYKVVEDTYRHIFTARIHPIGDMMANRYERGRAELKRGDADVVAIGQVRQAD